MSEYNLEGIRKRQAVDGSRQDKANVDDDRLIQLYKAFAGEKLVRTGLRRMTKRDYTCLLAVRFSRARVHVLFFSSYLRFLFKIILFWGWERHTSY